MYSRRAHTVTLHAALILPSTLSSTFIAFSSHATHSAARPTRYFSVFVPTARSIVDGDIGLERSIGNGNVEKIMTHASERAGEVILEELVWLRDNAEESQVDTTAMMNRRQAVQPTVCTRHYMRLCADR